VARVGSLGLLVLVLLLPFACSSQSEGQRCNVDNGNDDCESGLECKSSRELGGNADICCPISGPSESPECIPGGGTTAASTSVSTASGMGGMGGAGGTGGMGMGGAGGGTGGMGGAGGGTGGMGGAGGGGGAGGN
jgi:hypothetical protein